MGWHLTPSSNDKWSVRKSGAIRASRLFASQEAGREYAMKRAMQDRDTLYIHYSDGRIHERIDLGETSSKTS